ncbi:hypothetical protein KQX54_008232 [Cotesia glomerata]|uniref:Uncharacterized protein n=1 Tax=Cotesia glomerata TaxID=32391 RepID=A0AAV7J3S8_COTGL|nr:hypothetical protein KQX54_008232 [Cotesia glomerata]
MKQTQYTYFELQNFRRVELSFLCAYNSVSYTANDGKKVNRSVVGFDDDVSRKGNDISVRYLSQCHYFHQVWYDCLDTGWNHPILSSRYQMIPKTPLFLFPLFILLIRIRCLRTFKGTLFSSYSHPASFEDNSGSEKGGGDSSGGEGGFHKKGHSVQAINPVSTAIDHQRRHFKASAITNSLASAQ